MIKIVPAQWPQKLPTKIAFVGEAPGDTEVERGAPLVGPAGRIFNMMLRTANLERSDYLVTNVFNEKLPDNDVANWCSPLQVAREGGYTDLPPIGQAGFLKPEYRPHLVRLGEELQKSGANVIVPLGGTALWALTGLASISSQRGATQPATKLVPGVKMVPTFHPSFVQKQWKFYSVVVKDFIKAKREADRGPAITLPTRTLTLEPTIGDIRAYLPRLFASSLLSVDIETGWGQITTVGFAPDEEHAISIPFFDKRNADHNYWRTAAEEFEAWRMIEGVMRDRKVSKLGQNFAQYDAYWFLVKRHIAPYNLRHDTRLLHHSLYAELPKDLEFLGASYSEQGAWKTWGRGGDKRDD